MASLEELRSERIKKLEALRSAGVDPYPIDFPHDHSVAEVVAKFDELVTSGKKVSIVGRVRAIRGQGGILFCNLDDGTGTFQAVFKKDELSAELFERFVETVDLGDFIGVTGSLVVTKRGEQSVAVAEWLMLAKALRPLPSQWHGLSEVEERFRRRYLDSLMSPEVRQRFVLRSRLIAEVRQFLQRHDFMEVETPMLQTVAGGATATPFVTHHEALDLDLYLRVAPELHLKQMVIGGFSKVFELGRSFRNEGLDATHNPEFTSLEVYEAYGTPGAAQKLVAEMVRSVFKKALGTTEVAYNGAVLSFAGQIPVITFADLLQKYTLINDLNLPEKELALKAAQFGITVAPGEHRTKILDSIYKKMCRPKLIQPIFITDYPVEFSPLAKRQADQPSLISRFQLVAGGLELVNGFAELNDPLDQAERFTEQEARRASGDEEAQAKDDSYVEALEYGLPPTTGWGLGIDRLVMLATDTQAIREVIFFPTMRPR